MTTRSGPTCHSPLEDAMISCCDYKDCACNSDRVGYDDTEHSPVANDWKKFCKSSFLHGTEEYEYVPIALVNPGECPPLLIPTKKGELMTDLYGRLKDWIGMKDKQFQLQTEDCTTESDLIYKNRMTLIVLDDKKPKKRKNQDTDDNGPKKKKRKIPLEINTTST
jgi:hypothetical protein